MAEIRGGEAVRRPLDQPYGRRRWMRAVDEQVQRWWWLDAEMPVRRDVLDQLQCGAHEYGFLRQ